MNIKIIKNLVLNMSFLIIVAQSLTKSKMVKNIVYERSIGEQKILKQLGLALLFGVISIISTYMGVEIEGSIVNLRATSVLAAGIIGGPIVGIVAAIIAGIHRYFYDLGGLTSTACAIATFLEGIIGVCAFEYLRGNRWKREALFVVGLFTGIIEALMIAVVAKPYIQAIEVVKIITIPMGIFNALALVLFVTTFSAVFIDQDNATAYGMRLAMDISDKCLTMLRKGIYDKKNIGQVVKIILDKTDFCGAAIYSCTSLLAFQSSYFEYDQEVEQQRPHIAEFVFANEKTYMMENTKTEDPFYNVVQNYAAIATPLKQGNEVIGCLIIFVRKHRFSYEADIDFLEGLAKLFSTQIELAEVDKQKQLRQKAEFHALQTQINPHFLFNALNTIIAFCREKPDRARELLVTLSTYFRNTLNSKDYMIDIYEEIEHVKAYLELEKARFEERLDIQFDIVKNIKCKVPSFILQPIVENAVKHGAMKKINGMVCLSMKQSSEDMIILIQDNGHGMKKKTIEKLYQELLDSNKVGMSNVHKRLISIYGEQYGLIINSSESGTTVKIRIPVKEQKETL